MDNYNYKGFAVSAGEIDNIFVTIKAKRELKPSVEITKNDGEILYNPVKSPPMDEIKDINKIERAAIITVNYLYFNSDLVNGFDKASEMIKKVIDEYDTRFERFSSAGLKLIQNKDFIGANKINIYYGDIESWEK